MAGWSHEAGGTRWEVLGVEFRKARIPNVHPGSHPLLSARLAAIVAWLAGVSSWLAGALLCMLESPTGWLEL